MALHNCRNCGSDFTDPRAKGKAFYCSRKCYGEHRHRKTPKCHPDRKPYCNQMCKPCYNKLYRMARRNRQAFQNKQRYFRDTYGITFAQYLKMYKFQQGLCPICMKPIYSFGNSEGKRSACVEHDHKTKRVRGLVCHVCNRMRIGRNTLETTKRLLHYMESDFDGRSI